MTKVYDFIGVDISTVRKGDVLVCKDRDGSGILLEVVSVFTGIDPMGRAFFVELKRLDDPKWTNWNVRYPAGIKVNKYINVQ